MDHGFLLSYRVGRSYNAIVHYQNEYVNIATYPHVYLSCICIQSIFPLNHALLTYLTDMLYCLYMNVTQAYSFLDARHIWYPAGMQEWEVIDLAESIARSTK